MHADEHHDQEGIINVVKKVASSHLLVYVVQDGESPFPVCDVCGLCQPQRRQAHQYAETEDGKGEHAEREHAAMDHAL